MDEYIKVRGAKEHNLKNINIDIPRNQLVVITGLSGSGKSTLAFDTVYAEGQRRYVESLSSYARQFLQLQNKPDVESISGLSPSIAIDQKTISKNPRSTVGTITEIYDYLRLLYARVGIPFSPATGLPIQSQTVTQMVDAIKELPQNTKIYLMAPIARGNKGEHRKEFQALKKQGFQRVKIDGEVFDFDNLPLIEKNKKHDISVIVDRLAINNELGNRIADSIETALRIGDGLIEVEIVGLSDDVPTKHKVGDIIIFSEKFSCPISGFQIGDIEPRMFSFNSPYGACSKCDGLGQEYVFDQELMINPKLSLLDGAILPWINNPNKLQNQIYESIAEHYKFDVNTPFGKLSDEIKEMLFHGSKGEEINFIYNDGYRKQSLSKVYDGILPSIEKKWHDNETGWVREELSLFRSERTCSSCEGHRLKPESLCIKIADKHIGHISEMSISHTIDWFNNVEKYMNNTQQKIAERILKEIKDRLHFLTNVGLDYLTLSRESGTLSGGESQRIRLASQIGSGLTGVLYVLDEPSIGLHQSDNNKLIKTLISLRDLGNSVIVVEHDEDTVRAADHLIDIGIGAGIYGGSVIAQGTPKEVEENPESITGQYLSGKRKIDVPKIRRTGHDNRHLHIKGVRTNNLQNVEAKIPLGTFTCVTGVSGGGKSSLIIHTLYKAAIKKLDNAKVTTGIYDSFTGLEYIDKIIEIDQSPIGRTPRSNPATYTGAFTPIRDWFVSLPEAKARGYKPGRFSFNVKGGRCEVCQGDGMLKIEMHFLPDVYVKCDACDGARYNRETLEVTYKGKSISDVLNMTVDVALEFFDSMPHIKDKMLALHEVGLGYITLGQSATTLSGGEAQRVKLAKELAKRSTGRTLYILDEPTTGLHAEDISKLLVVLHRLVEMGNTVLVIEHNLDVIKTADHVIDIGPGGGDKGGRVVATGTPEEIVKIEESITGYYLKKYLD
jgi:excinuclease ABC subunit A